MHKLMDYVCEEIDKLERKVEREGKLSMSETQYLDLLSHTKKNMLKADEMSDEGYSMAYAYEGGNGDMGRDGRSYRSYAGRRGYVKRDSMGRYSRNGYSYGNDEMITQLNELMDDAPEGVRSDIQRLISKIEKM